MSSESPPKRRRVEADDDHQPPPQNKSPKNASRPVSPSCQETVTAANLVSPPRPVKNENENPTPRFDEMSQLLMVDLQTNDAETAAIALENFSDLLDGGLEGLKNAHDAMQLGAPALIVLALQKWKTSPLLQVEGFCCLASLAHLSGQETALARWGVLEVAATALETFPNSKDVQDVALHAVANVVYQSSPPILQAVRRFVYELDGLKLVHKAMRAFPTDDSLQTSACALLDNLAQHSEFHPVLVQEGLVSAAAVALETHFQDDEEEVQARASSFLRQISEAFQYSD